ncbi:MAG TPA: hypothetical protein VGB78_10520 [Thermoplasmata archaeon]|jgi:hypothetical protein
MAEASRRDEAPWDYDPKMIRQSDSEDDQPYFSYDWAFGTRITISRRGWRTQFMFLGVLYLLVSLIFLALGLYPAGVVGLILGATQLYSIRWMKEEVGDFKMLLLGVSGVIVWCVALWVSVLYFA